MQYRLKMALRLLWTLCFMYGNFAAAANMPPILGSAGPLSWQATKVSPVHNAKQAIDAASKLLAPASGTLQQPIAQLVQVTDSTPATAGHGAVNTVYTAWLVSASGFTLQNANTKQNAPLALSALLSDQGASTQQLYAVFTARNDSLWVKPYPGMKLRTAAADMEEDQWLVDAQPMPTTPKISIEQLLSTFWSTTGINPAKAGQIALIARSAAPQLPAQLVQGKQTPLYPSGSYWIMQVNGSKTHNLILPMSSKGQPRSVSQQPYMSSMASLIRSKDGKVLRSVYLP